MTHPDATAPTLLDQRRIQDVQRALDVPVERWQAEISVLESGILAGQSLDDLGETLNAWAANAIKELTIRYATAKERLAAER